ncbi:MAG: CHAT domain-containing protein, partial [Oscillatoriales cyanobacterium]
NPTQTPPITVTNPTQTPPITVTNPTQTPPITVISPTQTPPITVISPQENQEKTVINQPGNPEVTVINQQVNQQVTSTLESVEVPVTPIAPVTAIATPTPTPKPESSTLNPEDSQPRKIAPLDNPGGIGDRVLTIDPSITSQLSHSGVIPPKDSKTSTIVNPNGDQVLGYVPSPDRIFEQNNLQKTVWEIEKIRNQEFLEHLGVTANIPEQNVMINKFQNSLQTIQQKTGRRSGIIYLVSRSEQLEIILIPPLGQPIRYSVPAANRAALFPVVKQLRDEITNPRKINTNTYLPPAQQLYKWLFSQLEPDLEKLGIHTLLLSVDPGLRSLPFAALHDGKGFLIEKYNFSLIPSFSNTNTDYQSVRSASLLGMGRSEFVDQKPLPSVPLELQVINGEWRGQSFLNSTFTIDNLNSQHKQGGFRIVHLATHAEFLPGKSSNSYIQMWNYKLQLDRMESLNWRSPQVELLVLSACRTALGDREAELGFGGLAVKSGAKSALGSLWYVDDGGTLGLMSEFYNQLRGSIIKTEALQLAQQAMIAGKIRMTNRQLVTTNSTLNLPPNLQQSNRNFSHPYYWSSFTMIGNPW